VCNRVVIINGGHVVAEDTPENLTKRLRGAERISLDVRGPNDKVQQALGRVPNVLAVEAQAINGHSRYLVDCAVGQDVRADLASTVVGNGWGLLELRSEGMSL